MQKKKTGKITQNNWINIYNSSWSGQWIACILIQIWWKEIVLNGKLYKRRIFSTWALVGQIVMAHVSHIAGVSLYGARPSCIFHTHKIDQILISLWSNINSQRILIHWRKHHLVECLQLLYFNCIYFLLSLLMWLILHIRCVATKNADTIWELHANKCIV